MKRFSSAINGKKGGRPVSYNIGTAVIPEFNTIILTKNQFNTLIEKFGQNLVYNALTILNNWLSTSPLGSKHKGKNHYAQFRSDGWLINEARTEINM